MLKLNIKDINEVINKHKKEDEVDFLRVVEDLILKMKDNSMYLTREISDEILKVMRDELDLEFNELPVLKNKFENEWSEGYDSGQRENEKELEEAKETISDLEDQTSEMFWELGSALEELEELKKGK